MKKKHEPCIYMIYYMYRYVKQKVTCGQDNGSPPTLAAAGLLKPQDHPLTQCSLKLHHNPVQ